MTINLFIRKNLKVIIIIIFSILYIYTFFDEITEFNKGFGWDGPRNQEISKYGVETIINRTTTMHNVQGFLPMVIYEFLIKYFNFPNHSHAIVLFFKFFNIGIIIGIIYFIGKISKIRNYSFQVTALFYSIVLFSFFTLKLFNFNPVIRDHFSIFVSLLGIYSILHRNLSLIILSFLLSFFNQPFIFYILFIVIFFNNGKKTLTYLNTRLIRRLSVLFVIILIIYFVFIYFRLMPLSQPLELKMWGYPVLNKSSVKYSLFFMFLYFVYLIYCIVKSLNDGFDLKVNSIMILPIIIVLVIEYFANGYFPNKQIYSSNGFWYSQVLMPGEFLLDHLYYINISVIFLLFFLIDILSNAYKLGKGWFLSFIFIMTLMIIAETRIIIGTYVFLIFGLIDFLNKKKDTNIFKYLYLLIFILIISSRFWLSLNGNTNAYFLNFPYSPNITNYYFKLIYFIIFFLIAFWFSKKSKTLL